MTTRHAATSVGALALLVAALLLMASFAIAPLVQLSAMEEAMAQYQDTLSNLRRQIAAESGLRRENSEFATAEQDAELLLKGETRGIAGASLQKLMSNLVAAHAADASSFQILPPQEEGNLVRIPMSLAINVGIDGLRDILHGLETGMPLIFIDEIAVRSKQDDFRTPDPDYLGPLDVTLQLSGYTLKQGAP